MFSPRSALIALVTLLVALVPTTASADGKVTGKVVLSGKPLAEGKITLYAANGQFVGSKIKEGKFTIDRVPAGKFVITIEGKDVPPKYASEDTSALIFSVQDGDNQFDIALE